MMNPLLTDSKKKPNRNVCISSDIFYTDIEIPDTISTYSLNHYADKLTQIMTCIFVIKETK